MKKLKLWVLSGAVLAMIGIACEKNGSEQINSINHVNGIEESNNKLLNLFNSSVAIIWSGYAYEAEIAPYQLKIVSFNNLVLLKNQYFIDGVAYTDDGKFNDLVAGDGLYTSVNKLSYKSDLDRTDVVNFNEVFKYQDELYKYMHDAGDVAEKTSVSLSCKIRIARCPETNWWNSCWPLESPCNCIEFYDCELTLTYETD